MTSVSRTLIALLRKVSLSTLVIVLVASCTGSGTPVAQVTPSPVEGALGQGLIAYVAGSGLGVLDPSTGKNTVVAPLPAGGAFRITGPVWAPAPGVTYP